ncbi:MAG: Nif3-like dinuclear metal center hexameric protein [Salibacteraceae bacterium]
MKISDLIGVLESFAPRAWQENYDNSGLLFGDPDREIDSALVSLDCTEEVIEEAIDKKCGLVISHHPILFNAVKSITGKTYVERTLIRAIQNDVALYAIHTNLDNAFGGVSFKMAEKMGLENVRVLNPRGGKLNKIVVFTPEKHVHSVRNAMFAAGAGHIGDYDHCSFYSPGTGTFRALDGANPYVGNLGKEHHEPEMKIETIVPQHRLSAVLGAMIEAHPYEEVAYDIYPLSNTDPRIGSGVVGRIKEPISADEFLGLIGKTFNAKVVRHSKLVRQSIETVAICGGSGSFLMHEAIAANADVYVTADMKYHEWFDVEDRLIVADIGHFESEQFTPELIGEIIARKFPTFAVLLSEVNTNPVNYFISK